MENHNMTEEDKYRELMKKAGDLEAKAKKKEDKNPTREADEDAVNLYIGSIQAKLALLEKFWIWLFNISHLVEVGLITYIHTYIFLILKYIFNHHFVFFPVFLWAFMASSNFYLRLFVIDWTVLKPSSSTSLVSLVSVWSLRFILVYDGWGML